jgi:diguanylate cyclase (GGDEF)-like protein/PAS domain S-box-containing protein
MSDTKLPADEAKRLKTLRDLEILDTLPEEEFDALVRVTALVCGVPVALISLVDENRLWFKASVGMNGLSETPRKNSFCDHAILSEGIFEVTDATQNALFSNNRLVVGAPHIRYYASATLRMSDGTHAGTLSVIDMQPRHLDATQMAILGHLATAVVIALEGRRARLKEARLEARFSAIITSSDDAIISKTIDGVIVSWNPSAERIFGYSKEEAIGKSMMMLIPPDRAAEESHILSKIARGERIDHFETERIRKDGTIVYISATISPILNDAGTIIGASKIARDISEQKKLTADLAQQHELLRVTLMSIGDAVITTDALGLIDWLNPVAERLTGWTSAEAQGQPMDQVFRIVNEETRQLAENPVATCLLQGKVVGLANHTLLLSRCGEEFGIEDSAAPIRNARGEVLGVVLVFHDVTEARRMSGEMSYRATHDELTKLLNRAEFEIRLRRLLQSSHEDHSQHALMFIDLDQFKLVNDACGHSVGDQLLQQVSKLLSESVRMRDTLARLGGDEFGFILDHCSIDQAQRVGRQICERMEQFRFLHDGRRFRIGTSIGLVPVDNRWATTAAVMQAADTSCYAAKEAGRNRVHTWFDSDLAMHARHGEMQWTTRIEQALDENRFVLFGQRIHVLAPEPHGLHAEVLLRMVDADGSLILPGAFLPAAERFHLASRIDRWVLQDAVGWLVSQPDLDLIDTLCVNLSGQSVGDRAFHRQTVETLATAGDAVCKRLCLEITETVAVTNLADAALFIEQVKALGVRVALDDFGAGASSFGYLKTMKVDMLKIDGQFINALMDDPLDDAAVRCFVDVANVLGVKTVAEYVDRVDVLARIKELGIDYGQGFLLDRPEPLINLLLSDGEISRVLAYDP